jgi:cephalosporin hydroxylase
VEELKAQKVIELGVRYGVSTLAWIHALHRQGSGHLWAVDCSWPFYIQDDQVRINLLDPQGPLGMVSEWTFILGYDTAPSVLDALPDKDVDIIFIDTNHVYEETLVELDLYYPRVRKGGRIYLHDTMLESTGNDPDSETRFPVKSAIEKFCKDNHLEWSNAEYCYGLGLIQC